MKFIKGYGNNINRNDTPGNGNDIYGNCYDINVKILMQNINIVSFVLEELKGVKIN